MENLSRQDLDLILASRADADPGFRDRLLADPRGVLAEITGFPLPEFVKISVHPESLTDIHLVLPAPPGEVSEQDLALVAGGTDWGGSCAGCSL